MSKQSDKDERNIINRIAKTLSRDLNSEYMMGRAKFMAIKYSIEQAFYEGHDIGVDKAYDHTIDAGLNKKD